MEVFDPPSRTDTLFRNALIVSRSEAHLRTDRSCLRSQGVLSPRSFDSGVGAARYLLRAAGRENGADVHSDDRGEALPEAIFCDDVLEDMRGVEFIRLLRSHPRLRGVPVILLSVNSTRDAVLEAAGAGCAGYLIRPYSLDALAGQIRRAKALTGFLRHEENLVRTGGKAVSEEAFDAALARFAAVVDRPDSAEECFHQGIHLLRLERFNEALTAFHKAVKLNRLYGEAYMGMAEAWKGKGNMVNYRRSLTKAAEVFALQDRFDKAREVFASLQRLDSKARNPFVILAEHRLRNSDIPGAAEALSRAASISRDLEALFPQIARACHFTEHPERCARRLCESLGGRGGYPGCDDLYRRIMGPVARRAAAAAPGFFPSRRRAEKGRTLKLGLALSVARQTVSAYLRGEAATSQEWLDLPETV